jgi:alpha-galactosidase/6-phospho-beta-glucosidase family protein
VEATSPDKLQTIANGFSKLSVSHNANPMLRNILFNSPIQLHTTYTNDGVICDFDKKWLCQKGVVVTRNEAKAC